MHRRDFIRTTTALAGTIIVPRFNIDVSGQVSKRTRKSITDLQPNSPELLALKSAVKVMRDLNKSGDPKSWHALATIHELCCPHENWWFLPWHRAYLHFFERICQVLLRDDSFALPYWDWTRYPYIPSPFLDEAGPLWNKKRGPNSGKEIPWESIGAPALSSALNERAIGQVYGGKIDDDVQREHSGSGPLESVIHNGVHSAIGGDMLTPCSPEDPLFWVHHCNLDRIWTSWQVLHGGVVPNDKLWGDHQLAKFHDPDLKAPRLVSCSETVTSAEFIPQYDRLETPIDCIHSMPLPAPQIWLGPGEQVTVPTDLEKAVISGLGNVRDNKTTAFSIEMSEDFQRVLGKASSLRPDNYQYASFFVLLVLENIPFPATLTTMVRVFLDSLDSGPPPRFDDPAYVQTFSFFPVVGDPKHTGTTFTFDITPNIIKLAATERKLKNKVQFTLLPVDLVHPADVAEPIRPAKARIIAIG